MILPDKIIEFLFMKPKIRSLLQETIPLINEEQYLESEVVEDDVLFALKYSYNTLKDTQ